MAAVVLNSFNIMPNSIKLIENPSMKVPLFMIYVNLRYINCIRPKLGLFENAVRQLGHLNGFSEV